MRNSFFNGLTGRLPVLLGVVALVVTTAPAQSVDGGAAEVTLLRAEVKRLRLELLQHRAEFLEWKIRWISSELQQVQGERQRLSAERRQVEWEISELNHGSTNTSAEDAARREDLNGVRLPALLGGERAVVNREAALAAALQLENTQLTAIQKQIQGLN